MVRKIRRRVRHTQKYRYPAAERRQREAPALCGGCRKGGNMSEIQFVKNNQGTEYGGNPDQAGASAAGKAPGKKRRNKWSVLIVVLIVAVVAAGAAEIYLLSNTVNYGKDEPYIGVLFVEGTIQSSSAAGSRGTYQHDWLMTRIEDLMKDSNNKGLMIYVNSPGGSVYQTDELYLQLKEYKTRTKRPIYFYFGETAASGGYYIASAGDYICADRNTLTGSIGVYMGPVYSAEKLLEKLGVEADVIKSGRNKAMGSGFEDLTEEQRAIYQSVVDEMFGRFVWVVAEGRGMSVERVRQIADGRVYTAAQAKDNGLIDEICSYEDAVQRMQQEENLPYPAVAIKYAAPKNLYSAIFGLQASVKEALSSDSESEAEQVLRLIEENSQPGFYYMMQ